MVQQSENISQLSRKIRILWTVVIIILNVMIVSGILVAGLRPFNFFPENGCVADFNAGTFLFERSGIAVGKRNTMACQSLFNDNTFSLAFRVQPFSSPVYYATIFALYNSKEKILTVNQWKTKLIVESGTGRVVFGSVLKQNALVSVMITIAGSVLTVTCNDSTKNVMVDYSEMKPGTYHYFVFGNNASLHSPWMGALSSILLNKSKEYFYKIQVPRQLVPLKIKILTPPWKEARMERRYALDLIINLIGFVPLGISLCLLLNTIFSIQYYRYVVIMVSFLTSLFIEVAQVFLITRTSQMSDLILNSWGGVFGVVVYTILLRVISESKKIKNHR
ncbi:MAG TPA: VanZ family protein [Chitinispirillaceae bacterium]|nr:VanZ family protein [Chitinispirillaceae bacterium]